METVGDPDPNTPAGQRGKMADAKVNASLNLLADKTKVLAWALLAAVVVFNAARVNSGDFLGGKKVRLPATEPV